MAVNFVTPALSPSIRERNHLAICSSTAVASCMLASMRVEVYLLFMKHVTENAMQESR